MNKTMTVKVAPSMVPFVWLERRVPGLLGNIGGTLGIKVRVPKDEDDTLVITYPYEQATDKRPGGHRLTTLGYFGDDAGAKEFAEQLDADTTWDGIAIQLFPWYDGRTFILRTFGRVVDLRPSA